MISRRVLLGLIIAVGVFVPSWLEMEITFQSIPLWLVSQMAEWDSWRPSASRSTWRISSPDSAPTSANPSQPVPAATPIIKPLIAFEAISVEYAGAFGIAHDLNLQAEGDIREAQSANRVLQTLPACPDGNDSIGHSKQATPIAVDSPELRLAVSLCRYAEGSLADPNILSSAEFRQATAESRDPADDIFVDDLTGYEPPDDIRVSEPVCRPIASASGFEPIAVEQTDSGTAYDLNRASKALGSGLPTAVRLGARDSETRSRPAFRRAHRRSREAGSRHNRSNPQVVHDDHARGDTEIDDGGGVGRAPPSDRECG